MNARDVKDYYLYMLECDDASYYIGISNDPDRRVAQHNEGTDEPCYTYTRRPVRLVHASLFHEVTEPIAFEKRIKKWSRAKKRALIDGDIDALVRLSREIRPLKR